MLELFLQINGADGKFVLSNKGKEISLAKCATIIFNPLDISINDKKVVAKIYTELQQVSVNEEYYIKTKKIITQLQQYLVDLEFNCDLNLHINEDIDIQGLFKLFGIKIDEDTLDFTERFLQYIKIQNCSYGKKINYTS